MIAKHSATLHGHRTSFTLEEPFWQELKSIAKSRGMPLARLIAEIDDGRDPEGNLSSALRLYVLAWIKALAKSTETL
ncbi:ribbon-helix-helix domain-containing protein [Sinorhizobium americanum]|uniref:Arylsulfate sulfotransferase-likeprotein n=1 Tax=Sinorhizobium americanum TaxID=194963 RepID=A0A1L3LNU2_9HYPH|nr:ribbon-helix-helix domain-containing protein [Sinorhizobium americanum]APG85048.1 arylsulfate sulfotransferase-likeprotein [Sinorhizobium americanum CCGM7]APG91693.1 arylsulfate sulfotransferase-likeprotein [Sinorhizobium americanum]OAP47587.1 arylsulfate sulfotransferase [Sinorhizobium americanum]